MISAAASIENLLDNVSAQDSAMRALAFARFERPGNGDTGRDLYRSDAVWFAAACSEAIGGPRHRTMRRRGEAPDYPFSDPAEGTPGELVMRRGVLTLDPRDPLEPPRTITADSIRQAAFYRDAVELTLRDGTRILIRCKGVESLDVLFQAHF